MRILLILLFLMGNSAFGQNKIRPFVELNYGLLLMETRFFSSEYQVGIGVKLQEHWFFQLNLRQQNGNGYWKESNTVYLNTGSFSFSTSYRVLKNKNIISPALILDIGTETWSNGRGKLLINGNEIKNTFYQPMTLYNGGRLYYKIKLMADIQINSFNLLIGGSFNNYRVNISYLDPSSITEYKIRDSRTVNASGFSLESSLRYTLPIKKKKE